VAGGMDAIFARMAVPQIRPRGVLHEVGAIVSVQVSALGDTV